jgi:hypothetical protein
LSVDGSLRKQRRRRPAFAIFDKFERQHRAEASHVTNIWYTRLEIEQPCPQLRTDPLRTIQ